MKNFKISGMRIIKSIRDILLMPIAVLASVSSVAQQVWPVQISGAMIPPRSLDLGVYANERSQDLIFNAVLNDPVKTALDVTLSLSIEQNGEVIYQTNPNYFTPPMTLSQFKLEHLDGSALQPYLNAANLTNAQGTGTGSLELPEGFNQICLQVYGVQRNVPVSNKFCVQGSFFLNQPPQGIMPEDGDKMNYPQTQNQLFSWQPMHLGSSNSPGAVEYRFELVQLPDGTYNVNDAFESSLQVYRTTTMTPSLIYTQAEPQLIPNKVYAWRVKASSIMAPTSKLFQNDGYSEVYSFIYYDGEEPGIDINTFNNPAPLGCTVYNTDFGPISNTESITLPLIESDKVALGYFTMEIIEASGGAGGFSGIGKVAVPMLNTKVNVKFSGLKVNEDMRVYEVENVNAIVDNSFKLNQNQLRAKNIANSIDKKYVNNLRSFFTKGQGVSRIVSSLNITDQSGKNLPLAIDQTDQPSVAVIGMQFTAKNAYLNLASWKDQGGAEDPLRFAATALRATPHGVKKNAHLVLLNNPETSEGENKLLKSLSITYTASEDSRMYCDCKGYQELELEKSLKISKDIAVQVGNKERLNLDVLSEGFEDKVTPIGKLPAFEIVGLKDFEFESTSGTLDLSDKESVENIDLDSDEYEKYKDPSWKGVILSDVALKGGKGNKILGNEKTISMKGGKLFIDGDNLAYGLIKDKNILPLEKGKMGDWPYSIDEASFEIKDGESEGLELSGVIKLPVFDDTFPYKGKLTDEDNRATLNAEVEERQLGMSMWKASFSNYSSSEIRTVVAQVGDESQLIPSANFDGTISIAMSDIEFIAAVREEDRVKLKDIKKAFGIRNLNLNLSSITFNDFGLNSYAKPTDRYKVGSVNVPKEAMKIGGKIVEPGQVEVVHENHPDEGMQRLGLKITMYNGESSLDMIIWAKNTSDKFVFDEIEIDTSKLECNCTSHIVPPTESEWDRIFERIIYKYGPELEPTPNGSLASISDKKNEKFLSRLVQKIRLREGVRKSGMPMLNDNQIIIPFLNDKAVDAEYIAGYYHAQSYIDNYAGFKFSDLKTDQPTKLPIDVTNDLKIMGVKRENMPQNSKLLITGFRTSSTGEVKDDKGAFMKLMLAYEVYDNNNEKRYLYFDSKEVKVGPMSVDFSDLRLELVVGEYVDKHEQINILSSVKLGGKVAKKSIAHIDCHNGFTHFDIQGVYQPYFSSEKGKYQNTKILYRLPNAQAGASRVKEIGAKQSEFFFNLNTENSTNSHSLRHFIAAVSPDVEGSNDGWNFAVTDVEQLIFRPGDKENYSAFLDFDDTQKVEGETQNAGFTGLVFKHIEFELDGFKDENSKGLTLPIEDVLFDFESGLKKKYKNTSKNPTNYPIPRSRKALLGGWKYALSKIQFHFKENRLIAYSAKSTDKQEQQQGVFIIGETLVPIFDEEPPKGSLEQKFASGYVGFSGTLEFEKKDKKYEPKSLMYFNRFQEATYSSSIVPTLGMRMGHGSELKLVYNYGNGEFEPQATMNGSAGIYWTEETIKSVGLPDKVAKAAGGLSFIYDLFKYEGLKINSPDIATGCTGANTQNSGFLSGIKALEMGKWSVSKLENDEDDEDKGNNDKEESRGLQGFPVNIGDGMKFVCQTMPNNDINYVFHLPVAVNLMADEQGSKKGKTAGIKAEANLQFYTKPHEKGFSLEDVKLGCILIEGEVGPVSIKGGLNILRDYEATGKDLNSDNVKLSKWGSGFKGGVDISVLGVNIKAVAQYGRTRYDLVRAKTESINGTSVQQKYRYGFFDFEATLPAGIPILPPSPTSGPIFYIVGGGGGILYNMDLEPEGSLFDDSQEIQAAAPSTPTKQASESLKPKTQAIELTTANALPDNNECPFDSDMLTPGKSFSGIDYRPNQEAYGANISIIMSQLPPTPGTPQLLAGDVTLRMGLEKNNVGTIGLSYIQVDGNMYLSPTTLAERRDEYVAKVASTIKYDHPQKELTGSLELKAEFPMGNTAPLAKLLHKNDKQRRAILSNDNLSQKDRFKMVSDLNKGENEEMQKEGANALVKLENVKARFGAKFKDDFKWTFKLGSWGDGSGVEPRSGYRYSAVTFPMLGNAAFKFYMQMGMDVDPIPPIAELLPSWNTDVNFEEVSNRKADTGGLDRDGNVKSNDGIVIGALIEAHAEKSLGPLEGLVGGKIGFDASLTNKGNISCGSSATDRIGLNGWYAEGQAYAFLKAKLGLKYNLGFRKGKVNVFDAELAAMLRAMLPNPSYINGFVKGHYSVLNGLLDGKFNYQFEFGSQCSDMQVETPVIGIPIVESTSPEEVANETESVFVIPKLKTNWKLGSTISFPNYDKEGEISDYDNYRVELKEFYLTKKGSSVRISASIVLDDDNLGASLKMNEWLQPDTEYQMHYKAMWYVDREDDGSYSPLVEKGFVNPEKGATVFKTGAFPDEIYATMVESQTPGLDQRYWHEGYAHPHLRFNQADPNLAKMFPESVTDGNQTFDYEYVARVSSTLPNQEKEVFEVPMTKYPGSVPFKKLKIGSITYNGIFTLPTVESHTVTTKEINFPDFDGLASSLKGGQVYKIELVRRPEKPDNTQISEVNSQNNGSGKIDANGGSTDATYKVNKSVLDNSIEKQLAQYTKVLYTYHFAKSKYESLDEKLEASSVRYIRPILTRNDLSHPNEAKQVYQFKKWDTNSANWFETLDDYYAMTSLEGFDKYDLDRIKLNAYINKKSFPFYWSTYLYKEIYDKDHFNNHITDYFTKTQVINKDKISQSKKDYLEEVLKVMWDQKTAEGLSWNMDFHIPEKMNVLNQDEIKKGLCFDNNFNKSNSDSRTSKAVFNKKEQYGLLFQDLKSRVVINQLRLLYDISFSEKQRHTKKVEYTVKKKKSWYNPTKIFGSSTYKEKQTRTEKSRGSIAADDAYGTYWEHIYNRIHINKHNTGGINQDRVKEQYKRYVIHNDHSDLTLSFPVYKDWKEMNDKVTSTKNIDFALKPNHLNQGGFDELNGGKEEGELSEPKADDFELVFESRFSYIPMKLYIKNKKSGAISIPDFIYLENRNTHPKMAYFDKAADVVLAQTIKGTKIMASQLEIAKDGSIDIAQLYRDIEKDGINLEGMNLSDSDLRRSNFWELNVWLCYKNGNNKQYDVFKAELKEWETSKEKKLVHGLDILVRKEAFTSSQSSDYLSSSLDFKLKNLPYRGEIQQLPGTIKLANYDWGGPEISYHRQEKYENEIGSHRFQEGIDFGQRDNKKYLQVNKGEWTEYTVNVNDVGEYRIELEYASTKNVLLKILLMSPLAYEKAKNLGFPYDNVPTEEKTIELKSTSGKINKYTATWKIVNPLEGRGVKVLRVENQSNDNTPIELYNLSINVAEPLIHDKINATISYRLIVDNPGATNKEYLIVKKNEGGGEKQKYSFTTTSNLQEATQLHFIEEYKISINDLLLGDSNKSADQNKPKKDLRYFIETEIGELITMPHSVDAYDIPLGLNPSKGLPFTVSYVSKDKFRLGFRDLNNYWTQRENGTLKLGFEKPTLFSLEELSHNENQRIYNAIPFKAETDYCIKKIGETECESTWRVKYVGNGYYHLFSDKGQYYQSGFSDIKVSKSVSSLRPDALLFALDQQADGTVKIEGRFSKYFGLSTTMRRIITDMSQKKSKPNDDKTASDDKKTVMPETDTNYLIKVRSEEFGIDVFLLEDYRTISRCPSESNNKNAKPSDAIIWKIKAADKGYFNLYANGKPVSSFSGGRGVQMMSSLESGDKFLWSLEPQPDGSTIIKRKNGGYFGENIYDKKSCGYLKLGSSKSKLKFYFTKVN
ncbi:MAG: hypothetical protein V3V00_06300 [Saprospiraceae bacterium]